MDSMCIPSEILRLILSFTDRVSGIMLSIAIGERDNHSIVHELEEITIYAGKGGYTKLLKFIISCGYKLSINTLTYTIPSGNLRFIKEVYNNSIHTEIIGYNYNSLLSQAMLNGNMDVINWAFDNKFPFNDDTFKNAIWLGDTKILKRLSDRRCVLRESDFSEVIRYTIETQNYSIIESVINRGRLLRTFENKWYYTPAKNNDLQLMNYLYNEKINICFAHTFIGATMGNDDDVFTWLKSKTDANKLHELGYDENNIVPQRYMYAAKHNNFELLKKLYEKYGNSISLNPPIFINKILYKATKTGNIEMVKWLYENGCPLNHGTMVFYNNNLPVLKWLLSIGCPWGWNMFKFGPLHVNVEGIKWLLNNGYSFSLKTIIVLAQWNNIDILKVLYPTGKPLDSVVEMICIKFGDADILNWLIYEKQIKVNSRFYVHAVTYNKIEKIKLLHTIGCPYDDNIFEVAINNGNYDTLEIIFSEKFKYDVDMIKQIKCDDKRKHIKDYWIRKFEKNIH